MTRIIKINDITIRDTFQSVDLKHIDLNTIDRILSYLNELSFESLEVWGGFSFEKMFENKLGKSPWEILSYIKEKITSTPLKALIGAKNLVGLEIYPRIVIERFINLSIEYGIERFRVYDSLNDLNNLEFTISKIIQNNKKCEGTIIYHKANNIKYYAETAKKLEDMGCSSICIKDTQSTLSPAKSAELFHNLKSSISIPLFLSSYNLRGLQNLNYFEACKNGCDGIDFSFIPNTSLQEPAIFPFILSLKDTNLETDINQEKALEFYNYLKKNIYPYLKSNSYFSLIWKDTEKELLPKWVMNNLARQLEEIGEIERLNEVMEEILRIRKELGNPPMATPVCQIIGSQAILNTVISDYRWEIICDEMKKLLLGYYGKLPQGIDNNLLERLKDTREGEFREELQGHGIEDNIEDIEDKNKKKDKGVYIYEQLRKELDNLSTREEDLLSYCFFPEKTRKFLETRKLEAKEPLEVSLETLKKEEAVAEEEMLEKSLESVSEDIDVRKIKVASWMENLNIAKLKEITYLVETSNIDEIKLEVEGIKISISKSKSKEKETEPGPSEESEKKPLKSRPEQDEQDNIIEVKSPIVGIFYRAPSPDAPPFVKVGDKVKKGDVLCIIEAMKLMNKITSDYDGEIKEILVQNEEPVEFNQTLMTIKIEE